VAFREPSSKTTLPEGYGSVLKRSPRTALFCFVRNRRKRWVDC
jgi:hypothetical protein